MNLKKIAAYGAALAALLAVFALYSRPEIMMSVGEFVWACFN